MKRALLGLVLLIAPLLASAANAQDDGTWRLEDPVGDASTGFIFSTPAAASTPISRHIDITAVTIGEEDENGFAITIHVDRLKVGSPDGLRTGYMYVSASFGIQGSPVSYYVGADMSGALAADAETLFLADPSLVFGYLSAYNEGGIYANLVPTIEEDKIRLWVPKPFLMGIGAESTEDMPVGLPTFIGVGASIVDFNIYVYGSSAPFVSGYDYAPEGPDDAPPYFFQKPTANSAVRLDLGASYDGLSVQPGLNQSLPIVVTNVADGKRILQMKYELEGPGDKVPLYRVTGPPTITLPASATRNFSFALDVAPEARASDGVNLTIRTESLGFPDEKGYVKETLIPTPALGPTSNALYLLGQDSRYYRGIEYMVLCANPGMLIGCSDGFLSVDPQDPEAVPDQAIEGDGFSLGTGQTYFLPMYRETSAPVSFDPSGMAELHLTLRASAPVEGLRVEADMLYYSEGFDNPVFSSRSTVDVGTEPTTVTITAPVLVQDAPIHPRGTSYLLRLDLNVPVGDPGMVAFASGGIEILPGDSRIVLPLTELPEAYRTAAKPNPFQLTPIAGREEFVNPGEARLFNVSLLHQGIEPERARISAVVSQGWTVEILPGTEYELMPGDTVTLSVLAHAPSSATEGERGSIQLNATDPEGSTVGLGLTAIVTGFDLPDDSAAYRADADAQAKLVEAKGDSPGLEFLLVAAALATVALRRRKA